MDDAATDQLRGARSAGDSDGQRILLDRDGEALAERRRHGIARRLLGVEARNLRLGSPRGGLRDGDALAHEETAVDEQEGTGEAGGSRDDRLHECLATLGVHGCTVAVASTRNMREGAGSSRGARSETVTEPPDRRKRTVDRQTAGIDAATCARGMSRAARSAAVCAKTSDRASSAACRHASARNATSGSVPTNSTLDCAVSGGRALSGGCGGLGGEHAGGITTLLSLMQVNYGKGEIVKQQSRPGAKFVSRTGGKVSP